MREELFVIFDHGDAWLVALAPQRVQVGGGMYVSVDKRTFEVTLGLRGQ